MEQVRALPVPLAFRMDKRAKAMVKSAAVVSCCEQTFHMTCLCQWLEKGKEDHSSCPCCRAPIHHLLLANPPQAPAQALPSPEEALADAMSSPSEASFRIADAGELPSQEVDTADLHAPVDGEVEVDVEDPRPARRVVPNPLGRLGDPLTVGECRTSSRPRDAAAGRRGLTRDRAADRPGASGEVIADDGPESPVHIIDVGELQSALRHRDLATPQRNPTCDEMLQRPLLGMQVGILVLALFGTIIYFMVRITPREGGPSLPLPHRSRLTEARSCTTVEGRPQVRGPRLTGGADPARSSACTRW